MIISKEGQFVFIANTKTASTSIETLLAPHATIAFMDDPAVKHMGITRFEEMIKPDLDVGAGFESFAVVRDPIDWLFSWYRYRAREGLLGNIRSTAHLTFDEFVQKYLIKPREEFVKVGAPTGLLRRKGKEIAVDHVYAFEHIEDLVLDLGDRLGVSLELNLHLNVSPTREFELSATTYQELEHFFARDIEAYQEALERPRRITAA